jgi:uncharacterized protein
MKLLLLLILAAVAWLWWRYVRVSGQAARRRSAPASSEPSGTPATPQAMVDCPVCGLHLPRIDAVAGRLGLYCSEGHRDQHER